MSQPKRAGKTRTETVPDGLLPDFLVWPALLVLPLACLAGYWNRAAVATPDELKAAVTQILLTGVLLVYLLLQCRKPRAVLRFSPPVYGFAALFLLSTLSLAWAVNPDFWFYKWSRWYAAFVMFLLAYQTRQSTRNLDAVFQACLMAGVVTSLVGIAQHLFGLSLIPQTSPPSSTFGNGNVAGDVIILTAPVGIYLLCRDNITTRKAWMYAASVCAIALYGFYTRTRAVWLAVSLETVLVAAFIYFDPLRKTWLNWHRGKTIAAWSMTGVFLVMVNFSQAGFKPFWEVAAFEITSIAVDINDTQGNEASPRYLIWGNAIEMIKDHPWFGTGTGSYYEVVNNGDYTNMEILGVQRVHNDILEVGVDLGVAGWLCLAAIIVTVCRHLYFLWLHAEGKRRLAYALLVIAVTGSMLEAQLTFPFEVPLPPIFLGLYMAVVIRGGEHVDKAGIREFHPGRWFNKAGVAGAALMLVVVSVINMQWLYDLRTVSQMLAAPKPGQTWKLVSPVMSQAHITVARAIAEQSREAHIDQTALGVMKPIIAYWPTSLANELVMITLSRDLGMFNEAEAWGLKAVANEPENSFIGERLLIDVYRVFDKQEQHIATYQGLKAHTDEELATYKETLNTLHFTSINLGDYASTQHFYDLYTSRFPLLAVMEANQAVFYYNNGQPEAAINHVRNAVGLNPRLELPLPLRQLLAAAEP